MVKMNMRIGNNMQAHTNAVDVLGLVVDDNIIRIKRVAMDYLIQQMRTHGRIVQMMKKVDIVTVSAGVKQLVSTVTMVIKLR